MNIRLLLVILLLPISIYSQSTNTNFGGLYDWAGPNENDPWGLVKIHPNSENDFYFQLITFDNPIGLEKIVGQAFRKSDFLFEYFMKNDTLDCKLTFEFKEKYVKIYSDKTENTLFRNLNENFMKRNSEIPETYTIDNKDYKFNEIKKQ